MHLHYGRSGNRNEECQSGASEDSEKVRWEYIASKRYNKNPPMLPIKQETFLNSYRQIDDPELRRIVGDSPVMGIHLGLRGPNGIVRLGDPIYVGVPDDEVPSTLWPSQLYRWDSCEISEYEWSPEAKVADKHEKRSPRSKMRYQYNFTHRIYDCACETFPIGNNWWFGRTIRSCNY